MADVAIGMDTRLQSGDVHATIVWFEAAQQSPSRSKRPVLATGRAEPVPS